MALFTNFAVEVESHDATEEVERRFAEGSLQVEGIAVEITRKGTLLHRGLWYFYVEVGYLNGWHPEHPFLNTPKGFAAVREAFYTRMAGLTGFRRALFDHEAADSLLNPVDDYRQYGFVHMLVRQDLISDPAFLVHCSKFGECHCRVIDDLRVIRPPPLAPR